MRAAPATFLADQLERVPGAPPPQIQRIAASPRHSFHGNPVVLKRLPPCDLAAWALSRRVTGVFLYGTTPLEETEGNIPEVIEGHFRYFRELANRLAGGV